MIPKTIYFTFGFSPDFGGKPFNLVHFLAIKSAKVVNDCDIVLYYKHEPEDNVWWEEASDYCIHEKCQPPTEIFGNPLPYPAYQSDVFRLDLLNYSGGVYFDIDTISIKPIDSLLSSSFVMGQEWANGKQYGLCNAVMLAEPNSNFGLLWTEEYKNNYDGRWGVMSVVRPWELSKTIPESITVLDGAAFFKYGWGNEEIKKVHREVSDIDGAYVLHLWEQNSYTEFLNTITVDDVRNRDSTYNLLARRFL